MDADEVDNVAQKLLNEGNYLQSFEEFTKILMKEPKNQKALEGRLSSCLELQLFHRCLKDIEKLSQINPCNTKVHNLAGQIYERISSYENSISAYLKAYLYEEQEEQRLEIMLKISHLCSILLRDSHTEIPGKKTDCFETFVMLFQKLADQDKYQVCLEVIVTAILAHCLHEFALNDFKTELNACLEIDNDSREHSVSKQSPDEMIYTLRDTKYQPEIAVQFVERENPVKISKSVNQVIADSSDIDCKLEVSSETQSKYSNMERNLITAKTPQNKLIKNSVLNALRPSSIASSNAPRTSGSTSEVTENSDSFTAQPKEIFLPNIESESINTMLLHASECSYKLGKFETSLWFAKKLLSTSQTSREIIWELKAYSQLGFLYIKGSDHELGLSCYSNLRAKCREILKGKNITKDEMEISAIERENTLKLCSLFKDLETYEPVEMLLEEFFAKVELVEQDSLVRAYGILGEIERAQGRYEDSIRSFKTQLALCLKYNDQKGLALAYSNLGKVCKDSGNTTSAMEWFQLSLHTAKTVNDPLCLATAYSCFGEGLLAQNKPRQALSYFEKELDLSTAIDEQVLRVEALTSLGKTYQDLRLFQHAEFFHKRALLEARDLKINLEEKIIENLVEVLLTLGKFSEGLHMLHELRDRLEATFHRQRRHKIVISHPLLDKIHACVDRILVLLVEDERIDEAFELAVTSNSILLNQMLTYKAYVEGSEVNSEEICTNFGEIYQVVKDSNKVVLYYRVVQNGYMVWIIGTANGMVLQFHWHKAPIGLSFKKRIEDLMNGLLQPADPLASYSCDHRKVSKGPQILQDTPLGSTSKSNRTSRSSTTRSKYTPQRTLRSNTAPASTSISKDNHHSVTVSKDFIRELSELFIFPIEEKLANIPDISSYDLVIVNSSFLSMIPFTDLHTSNGTDLSDLANSVQLLPCISVLKILQRNKDDSAQEISIIGNPEIKFPEMLAGFKGHVKPDFMEQEINDVAVLLGTIPDVGPFATKEQFFREFQASTLMHLATYASQEQGIITLAPIPDIDSRVVTRAMSRDSWEIILEDIVTFRRAPDVVVLTSGFGCRNRFEELSAFNANLPLAFMLAGVKTVVMATWSTPQNASLACLRQFYKNVSNGLTVTCALSRAKKRVKEIEEFHEPLYWASFSVYGHDNIINVEELRRNVADASFSKAQTMAVERFPLDRPNEESSDGILSQRLVEAAIQFLHRHHLQPNLVPILLQVIKEAIAILQNPPSNEPDSATLPYREITAPWLSLICNAEKFLHSFGFCIKATSSKQTILVYPHWNRNNCLEKAGSLLQSVLNVLSNSPVLADALRTVLSQEEESLLVTLRNVLQERLACPYEIVEIKTNALLKMLWLKRNTKRLMIHLGFYQMGSMLEFRNTNEDRNLVESCVKIFSILTGFETSTQVKPHPMLSKANLGKSWMSYEFEKEENTVRYFVAKSLDSIDVKYKLAMKDVREFHNRVLLTQAKVAESKRQQTKLNEAKTNTKERKEASKLPQIKVGRRQPLDLVELGEKITKIKVKSGSGPSSVRVPVEKKEPLPLVECMMKRNEAMKNLYQCLGDIKHKKTEETRKLLSL